MASSRETSRDKNLGITPRSQSYSDWYNDIVLKAQLADYSPVRGCMVIRPYGYAIWERLKQSLDDQFKETGHENAAFPLFIPLSFLSKEAEHVEGFAKECALVTHTRLVDSEEGVVPDPASKLEEPLVVRPTSETIINAMYSKWVQSYRDLPILINQWANVVRWEMRTRLFLRTTEFFWQEGHTVHETPEEAQEEVLRILEIYRSTAEEVLAIPVYTGVKSDSEKFAGANETYTIEALMPDGKALQSATSHNLGQNFAKAFDVKFVGRDGKEHLAWQTSWGASTRLIGALVMCHSDDQGLVLPPKVAQHQVVIVPIARKEEEKTLVGEYVDAIVAELKVEGVRVKVDDRDYLKPGFKFNEWEQRGVPLRMEVGPRDVASSKVVLARRDTREKEPVDREGLGSRVCALLDTIQASLFERARAFRDENTRKAETYEELIRILNEQGGFVLAPWDGDPEIEAKVKAEAKATVRCIREQDRGPKALSIGSTRETEQWVMFAKSY